MMCVALYLMAFILAKFSRMLCPLILSPGLWRPASLYTEFFVNLVDTFSKDMKTWCLIVFIGIEQHFIKEALKMGDIFGNYGNLFVNRDSQ